MAVLEEPVKGVRLIKNFINGEWLESKGETHDVVNPANCQIIARAPDSTKDEVNAAVQAAKEVFPSWRTTPPRLAGQGIYSGSNSFLKSTSKSSVVSRPRNTARLLTSPEEKQGAVLKM